MYVHAAIDGSQTHLVPQAIADKLQQILDMVAGLASDPHPRVLFSVADAIGNIAEVFDASHLFTNLLLC